MKSRKLVGYERVKIIIGILSFLMPLVFGIFYFFAKLTKEIDRSLKSRLQRITKMRIEFKSDQDISIIFTTACLEIDYRDYRPECIVLLISLVALISEATLVIGILPDCHY